RRRVMILIAAVAALTAPLMSRNKDPCCALHLSPEGRGRLSREAGKSGEGVRVYRETGNPLTPPLSHSGRGSRPSPRQRQCGIDAERGQQRALEKRRQRKRPIQTQSAPRSTR